MRNLLRFAIPLMIVLAVACSKKTVPSATSITSSTTTTTTVAANVNSAMAADIQKGKQICAGQCARCHQLHLPAEFTHKEWDNILPGMFAKANTDTASQRLIRTYIYSSN